MAIQAKKNSSLSESRDLVAKALAHPSSYARVRLGLKPHPVQEQVLESIFYNRKPTCFRAANEVGKTTVVCTAAILYALEILGARAISTASVWRQISEQLVPSLKRYVHLFPHWRFLDAGIADSRGIDIYSGFSATDEAYAQGYHAAEGVPLLAIIDEAAGVSDSIFNAIEERVNPTFLLICGSTLGPEGRFYKTETDQAKFYEHFKLTQPDCAKSKGWWLEDEIIQRKIDKWGASHPLVVSSVFADFATNIEGALLTLAQLDKCLENPPKLSESKKRHVFCDFAAGGAENVVAVCVGNKAWLEKCWTQRDTMQAAAEFIAVFKKLEREIGLKPNEVEGDADGLGLPMIQRIKELGWNISHFHGGADPRFDEEYKNLIGEVWGCGCRKIAGCQILIPRDDELRAQLLNRKVRMNSSGLLEVETKREMAARSVESPDRADALLGAIHPMFVGLRSGDIVLPKADPFALQF